jgi:hypothetical protein
LDDNRAVDAHDLGISQNEVNRKLDFAQKETNLNPIVSVLPFISQQLKLTNQIFFDLFLLLAGPTKSPAGM